MNTIIKEANRYISNAKDLLEEKAIRENGEYLDKKYIKMAGHTAYTGVLYALDQLIEPNIETRKRSKRKSVDYYRLFLSGYDKKMLSNFNNLYNILHLDLGYDGITDAVIIKRGMSMAKEFVSAVATRLN